MPDCRYCGHPEAYDSGFSVECPNEECDHFSPEQERAYNKWAKTNQLLFDYLDIDEEAKTDPDITPIYKWGIRSVHWPEPED